MNSFRNRIKSQENSTTSVDEFKSFIRKVLLYDKNISVDEKLFIEPSGFLSPISWIVKFLGGMDNVDGFAARTYSQSYPGITNLMNRENMTHRNIVGDITSQTIYSEKDYTENRDFTVDDPNWDPNYRPVDDQDSTGYVTTAWISDKNDGIKVGLIHHYMYDSELVLGIWSFKDAQQKLESPVRDMIKLILEDYYDGDRDVDDYLDHRWMERLRILSIDIKGFLKNMIPTMRKSDGSLDTARANGWLTVIKSIPAVNLDDAMFFRGTEYDGEYMDYYDGSDSAVYEQIFRYLSDLNSKYDVREYEVTYGTEFGGRGFKDSIKVETMEVPGKAIIGSISDPGRSDYEYDEDEDEERGEDYRQIAFIIPIGRYTG